MAQELEKQLRGTDFIGRFGGEEFIVFAGSAELEKGIMLGERLRGAVDAMEALPPVTVSVGVSSTSSQGVSGSVNLMEVIDAADQACYVAKDEGRNCVRSSERFTHANAAD